MNLNKHTLLLLFIFFCVQGFSQNNKKDTSKVRLLNDLGKIHIKSGSDTSVFYYKKAISLSDSIDFKKGLIISNMHLGDYYKVNSKYDSAIFFYEKSKRFAKTYKFYNEEAESSYKIGHSFYAKGEFDKAMKYYQKAYKQALNMSDSLAFSRYLVGIGNVYIAKGLYSYSLEAYLEALQNMEKLNYYRGIAVSNMNIGNIYLDQKEYDLAIDYYKNSLLVRRQHSKPGSEGACLANIGDVFFYKNEFDSALFYYEKGNEVHIEQKSYRGLAMTYMNMGNVYRIYKDYDKAFSNYKNSMFYYKKINNDEGLLQLYNNIGKTHKDQKDYKNALIMTKESLKMARDINSLSRQKEAYESLYEINKAIGDYKNALENHILYKKIYDSIYNQENKKKLIQLEVGFEFKKKEEIIKLEKETAAKIYSVEIKQQKNYIKFFIGGLILLLITIIFIYRNYRIKNKSNKRIKEKNIQLEQQKEEIIVQNEKLQELTEFKQGMVSMVVHDMKNPLNYIITATKKQNSGDFKLLNNASKQMLTLVQNMLDVQKMEDNKFTFDKTSCSLNNIIEDAVNQVLFLSDKKAIQIKYTNITDYQINADISIIERVFINLLTNAIKFSPVNGTITISCNRLESGYIKVLVNDLGKGIPKEKQKYVFEKFVQVITKKSGDVRSTGLGLAFCKLAVEAHKGGIGVNSELNSGTSFWFTLPISGENEIKKEHIFKKEKGSHSDITLSDKEKSILKPILNRLQEIDFFESSDITEELSKLKTYESGNIYKWKNKVEDAVFECNKEFYNKLIEKK